MKIFISWSGPRSYGVASRLKEWLPLVLPAAEPWLSTEDIRKGSRWQAEMTAALENPAAGILVLTNDNLQSAWLHFEAGAISKAVTGASLVCTYLVGVDNADLGLPLGMFQSTTADKIDTLRLVRNLNALAAAPIPAERIEKLFTSFWPELEATIGEAQEQVRSTMEVRRDDQDLLSEILETVRGLARRAESSSIDLAASIRQAAATPGSHTHKLFERMQRLAQHGPVVVRMSEPQAVQCPFCAYQFVKLTMDEPCPSCGRPVT